MPGDPHDMSSAAHQLRTPLTAILGFAELLLLDDVWLDKEQRVEILDRIIASVKAETQIIEQWLEGAGGHEGLAPSSLFLRNETEHLLAKIEPLLVGHRISIDICPDMSVVAEKGALGEILSNLVTNAAKYSPSRSAIAITAEASDDVATVTVHNEGNGLSEGDLDRIFERGVRIQRNGDKPGSGLGLSIARELVTELGGRIWAASGPQGTDFAFTLPLAPAPSRS